MSDTTSTNRLGGWLSEVYGVVSEVKSIITDTATTNTATATSPNSGNAIPTTASASPTATAATGTTLQTSAGQPSTTSGSPQSSITSSSSLGGSSRASTNSNTLIPVSSASSPLNQQPSASATPSASGSSIHHKTNLLPIILGVVLGVLALLVLGLLLCCCLRRRKRRRNGEHTSRLPTPDDDEVLSWRPHRNTRGATVPAASEPDRPLMAEHPAYRGIETGSTNPFVPALPPPRRAAASARSSADRPSLNTNIGPAPSQYNFTPNSPSMRERGPEHGPDPLSVGVAGVAAGVAASKIRRKPVNSQGSEYPEVVSPSSPIGDEAGGFGRSGSRNGYRPVSMDDPRGQYAHGRSASGQALMGDGDAGPHNTYSDDRPPTPFGLSGFGKGAATGAAAGATAGALAEHHHNNNNSSSSDYNSSNSSGNNMNRQSYESAHLYPGPSRTPAETAPSPATATRHNNAGRRVSFVDDPSISSGTPHSSTQSGSSGHNAPIPENSVLGHTDYAYPLPTRYARHPSDQNSGSGSNSGSQDSTYRLSSFIPGAWSTPSPRHSRDTSRTTWSPPNSLPEQSYMPGATSGSPTSRGKRLRLSDIRAQEQQDAERQQWESQTLKVPGAGNGMSDQSHPYPRQSGSSFDEGEVDLYGHHQGVGRAY